VNVVSSTLTFFWEHKGFLLLGALQTVQLTAISVAIGIVIGTVVGICRVNKSKILRLLAAAYADFLRGTPLLVQIFLVHYGLPAVVGNYVPGFHIDPFVSAIIALSINSGAYVSEIVRAGIQSIDKGQMEAGRSLGMTYGQTMRHIILPQAFRRIVPPLGNEFIALLKDSSLVFAIGYSELMTRGKILMTKYFMFFETWVSVAVVFLCMTLLVSRLVTFVERRMAVDGQN
jgi:glutamine transport system permease protein